MVSHSFKLLLVLLYDPIYRCVHILKCGFLYTASSEHGISLPDNPFIVSCKECNTAYSVSIRVPSISKIICLYFMLPPFPVCIKITYHPAWISYCTTIRRDRADNYTSSPYHAVFSYSDSGQKNTAAANPDITFYFYRTCIGSKKCCLTFPPIRHKPFLW